MCHLCSNSFTVPVNMLKKSDGTQRWLKEGISYEHQYNSRLDPSYPIRSKVFMDVFVRVCTLLFM